MINLTLSGVTETGPFEYRWPHEIERFDGGWEGEAIARGRRVRFRHGVGIRIAYGRPRVRTVTWLGGQPTAEGVEADDYPASRGLISRIRRADNKLARAVEEIPEALRAFPIVEHRSEIEAAYSPKALAVKLGEDDLHSWVAFALIRAEQRGKAPPSSNRRDVRIRREPAAEVATSSTPSDRRAVADALLRFGASDDPGVADRAPVLTSDPEANALVTRDPFAFLLAVIFDQSIPYERAWRAPLELRARLGHLDPARMVSDPEGVRRAVSQPPALHRYVNNVPAWIVLAAGRVMETYGGDAGRIWIDQPTARELQRRLSAFSGIGQKKAAMAVLILERDLKVPIRDMGGSDIAYDIHVRRVFLRTGLADRDELGHMIETARMLHPAQPGALDLPAWRVGVLWCHPRDPECPACTLSDVCAKLIDRASDVS